MVYHWYFGLCRAADARQAFAVLVFRRGVRLHKAALNGKPTVIVEEHEGSRLFQRLRQGQTGQTGMGAMAQMMAPEHIEGRIAFLKAELKITPEQEPLWNAFAEVLRANARGMMDGMMQAQGAMGRGGGAAATPLQRVEVGERSLASRLESVRKLKAVLIPLYQSLEGAQKTIADKLLVPLMMGII